MRFEDMTLDDLKPDVRSAAELIIQAGQEDNMFLREDGEAAMARALETASDREREWVEENV